MLDIGASGTIRQDCLFDTGAVLSVFPQRQWERFADEIAWLQPDKPDSPEWMLKVTGLGGHSFPCQLGRIMIRIIELPSRVRTPAVPIIAKFPTDGGAYTQILLGLGGGALASWRLALDYSKQSCWLEY